MVPPTTSFIPNSYEVQTLESIEFDLTVLVGSLMDQHQEGAPPLSSLPSTPIAIAYKNCAILVSTASPLPELAALRRVLRLHLLLKFGSAE